VHVLRRIDCSTKNVIRNTSPVVIVMYRNNRLTDDWQVSRLSLARITAVDPPADRTLSSLQYDRSCVYSLIDRNTDPDRVNSTGTTGTWFGSYCSVRQVVLPQGGTPGLAVTVTRPTDVVRSSRTSLTMQLLLRCLQLQLEQGAALAHTVC